MFTQLKRKNAVIYSITTFYKFLKVVPPERLIFRQPTHI